MQTNNKVNIVKITSIPCVNTIAWCLQTDRTMRPSPFPYLGLGLWVLDSSAVRTFVTAFDQRLIDVQLLGVFQDVEETQVDGVRLFHDDVQQGLGGLHWTISQTLNWLQFLQGQRVTLVHTHGDAMCVQFCRQIRVLLLQYIYASSACNTSSITHRRLNV